MDIHRCRFVPYPPQAITALAFSHSSDSSTNAPDTLRLALGRSSGDIEIWNPQNGSWFQETTLRGGKDRSIEGLAWTQDRVEEDDSGKLVDGKLRLFSIGDSTTVTEWDLAIGAPARHANGNSSDIWCLAAQPRSQLAEANQSDSSRPDGSQLLAAGTSNGTIVLFSTDDHDLRFLKAISRPSTKNRKVLSITWRDRTTVVAGFDDSSIRVYDILSKSTIRTMTLGRPGEGSESLVWCVKCLSDGTILSGDSSGELKIWDATNYSLVQRLKAHDADVLDIGSSISGDMIVTVGVDRRTVAYKPVNNHSDIRKRRWAQLMHRRFHQHDIKTVATFESKELSVLVSGGVDTVPVVAPMKQWQEEYHRTLTNLPQKPQLGSAAAARLLLSWWGREILIWHIRRPRHSPASGEVSSLDDRDYELVSRIVLNEDENITSAQISGTGNFVIVATAASVKLFQLRITHRDGTRIARTRSIELPVSFRKFGARVVAFSPDGRWLCAVRLNNTIVLTKLSEPGSVDQRPMFSDKVIKLERRLRKDVSRSSERVLGNYGQSITCLTFATDSQVLATGDISGAVDTWVLAGHESKDEVALAKQESDKSSDESAGSDSEDDGEDHTVIEGQKWIRTPSGSHLPRLNAAILALTFRATQATASEHAVKGNIGVHATRHNPHPISHDMPTGDYRLIAVTAHHQLVEFDVLGCRLSDWTRRNPTSCLPHELTKIKDRVMDCFWDGRNGLERLWLFGPSWLFMLDMSQDLPASQPIGRLGNYDVLEPLANVQTKRKRQIAYDRPQKVRNTGAGDEVHARHSYTGIGRYVQKFRDEKDETGQLVTMTEPFSPVRGEDLDLTSGDSNLAVMRRNVDEEGEEAEAKRGEDDPRLDHAVTTSMGAGGRDDHRKKPGWWLTFEYRSTLGMMPFGTPHADHSIHGDSSAGVATSCEVVVIERPVYDLDLPPRFDGGQDWET